MEGIVNQFDLVANKGDVPTYSEAQQKPLDRLQQAKSAMLN